MLSLSFLVVVDMIYNINHAYISTPNSRCKHFLNVNTSDTRYVSTGCLDNLQSLKPSGVGHCSEEVSQKISKIAHSPSQSKELENLKSPCGFCSSGTAQSLEAALAPVSMPVQEDLCQEAEKAQASCWGAPSMQQGLGAPAQQNTF